jgi:hypothetical protein
MPKNPIRYTSRRRFSRVGYKYTPLREVLRIVERQISTHAENAKSLLDFRGRLLEICNDEKSWKQITNLEKAIKDLKVSLDDIGL